MSSFVEEFFRNPAMVGSLIPSSRELTNKVIEPIDFAAARCIVEYGPGTGVFTDILVARRRAETTIVLVETNRRFATLLQERYTNQPNVHIIHGSADKTGDYLKHLGVKEVEYVVCGLPFSSLPRKLGWRIVEHTQQLLLPAGKLILFQYSLQNRKLFEKFFRLTGHTHVLLNLPPAYVLAYEPREAPATNQADEEGAATTMQKREQ
ncbi:class I SAM-dependent methyltransferase [Hymenobacter cavernae]|uniref:SAM-dependent methyltransferase n=1 Tax=Hymenobacter cavernae TaxID=2044852 RepID=A0ABQ1USN8_9BACT|nr:rRNA adenine N-6-methyltransferase family protein [Hymenobacter cavernae]GGF26152.1 SAM-dependent methyltransferase [Hymenobacter cavernae]